MLLSSQLTTSLIGRLELAGWLAGWLWKLDKADFKEIERLWWKQGVNKAVTIRAYRKWFSVLADEWECVCSMYMSYMREGLNVQLNYFRSELISVRRTISFSKWRLGIKAFFLCWAVWFFFLNNDLKCKWQALDFPLFEIVFKSFQIQWDFRNLFFNKDPVVLPLHSIRVRFFPHQCVGVLATDHADKPFAVVLPYFLSVQPQQKWLRASCGRGHQEYMKYVLVHSQ